MRKSWTERVKTCGWHDEDRLIDQSQQNGRLIIKDQCSQTDWDIWSATDIYEVLYFLVQWFWGICEMPGETQEMNRLIKLGSRTYRFHLKYIHTSIQCLFGHQSLIYTSFIKDDKGLWLSYLFIFFLAFLEVLNIKCVKPVQMFYISEHFQLFY